MLINVTFFHHGKAVYIRKAHQRLDHFLLMLYLEFWELVAGISLGNSRNTVQMWRIHVSENKKTILPRLEVLFPLDIISLSHD